VGEQNIVTTPKIIPHSKPWITNEDSVRVDVALRSGMIARGEMVDEFEKSVCNYLGVESAVATSSGTAALVFALQVLGVGIGSEVILPTYVCGSVLKAVVSVGATPVICDVGPNWVMTRKQVEPVVTSHTAAIVAVHIFGIAVDIPEIQSLGIPVIEDACQAFGLQVNGVLAGAIGELGVLSFHATKCLTTAEGGMLVGSNSRMDKAMKQKHVGAINALPYAIAPLSDFQAVLGISQLERYEDFLERRNTIMEKYFDAFSDVEFIKLPAGDIDFLFRFPLRINVRSEEFQTKIAKSNVHIRKGVDSLLHRELGLSDSNYPNAIKAYNETISIPFYPALSDAECDEVIKVIRDVFE
jgi:UDP-4-amino-4-deoxy-L-arabinose-oxoglutarate aminotransferase